MRLGIREGMRTWPVQHVETVGAVNGAELRSSGQRGASDSNSKDADATYGLEETENEGKEGVKGGSTQRGRRVNDATPRPWLELLE
jgi:hypothetical protein